MTMGSGIYGPNFADSLDASASGFQLDGTDTIKVPLVTDTFSPAFNSAHGYGNISNEITGTGYTAGGATGSTPTLTASGGYLTFDITVDTQWTSSTFSAVRGTLPYNDTVTTPVADPFICGVTFGADYAVTSGTLTIQWNASGVMRFQYA